MRPPEGMGGGFPQNGMQPPTNRQDGQAQPNRRSEQAPQNRQGGQMPPNMQGGQMPPNMKDGQVPPNMEGGQMPLDMQGGQMPPNMQGGQTQSNRQGQMGRQNGFFGGFMGGRGSNGGSLEYSNDEVSSYSAIFNNVVGKGNETDFKRVINALKALSKGEDLETYFDVDKILRYLAAHTVVVNLDSYSSNMAQNYYLYENNGKVTILPWDYNLAWGGFQFGNATTVINFPIDTPVSGVDMSSRPLIEKLFSNTEYLEKYHSYLQELMTKYFANGKWEEKIEKLDALISDYVKNDKTAFCTFEDYKTAVETFKTVGNLRYQSIQGQLDGTVPSTTADQNANPDKLISAGDLNLSLLGTMMGGGNRGGMGGPPNWGNQQDDENFDPNPMGNMADPGLMMQAMQIIQEAGGNITDEVKTKLLDLGLTEEQISMFSQMGRGFPQWPGGNMQNTMGNNGRMPDRGNTSPFRGNTASSINTTQTLLIYSGLFVFVLISTFFVAKKKRNY